MHTLLFYLCTFIFSLSFAMEKPLQKSLFASDEVVQQAIEAVTHDHLMRLKGLLETHTFDQKTMQELLNYAMGSKEEYKEYMASFVLLLGHGAPVNFEIDLGADVADDLQEGTFLEKAIMYYPAYIKPLMLFGANLNAKQVEKMQPYFEKEETQAHMRAYNAELIKRGNYAATFLKSQIIGRPVPLLRARLCFAQDALRCSTYLEAVQHEDLDSLKLLLAKPFVGNAEEKDKQLCFAVDEAFKLESTAALDELAKHGAPIAQRLNLHFLFNSEVIEHCARNGYITLQDLANYKARIPERRIGMMWQWTQQKFEAHIGRLKASIDFLIRLLERGELEKVESHKKARTEKKDE